MSAASEDCPSSRRQGEGQPSPDSSSRSRAPRARSTLTAARASRSRSRTAQVSVTAPGRLARARSLHGLTRSLVANLVKGVATAASARSRSAASASSAEVKGKEIHFAIGFSHPVVFPLPEGVTAEWKESRPATRQGRPGLNRGVDKDLLGRDRRPRCARCALPSPTRARASSTPRRPSAARRARPARPSSRSSATGLRSHPPDVEERTMSTNAKHASSGSTASGASSSGTHERPAALGLRIAQAHLCAGRRRRTGTTLAFASSLTQGAQGQDEGDKKADAQAGRRARRQEVPGGQEIEQVVFDRNGFPYHGRIAAVADGARARPGSSSKTIESECTCGDSNQSE